MNPWAGRAGAPARYATPRTPTRATFGAQVAVVSAALGEPLMPWQQQVADVALELDDERPGQWRYRTVVVTVPRQSGKTTLLRAVRVHRAISRPHQTILMTAQRGKDARKQWTKMHERVTSPASPIRQHAHVRRSAGTEALTFPNRSSVSPFAPTPTSVHGDTVHLVDIDEAWAFGSEDGTALLEAVRPTQIAVPSRQLWIVSTAGTLASTMLREYVDRGRASVSDPSSRLAYFEWSAPDGADIYDPEVVAGFHPAAGFTQPLEDLMAEATAGGDDPDKARSAAAVWRRSYCNLWAETEAPSEIDLDQLAATARLDPDTLPPHGEAVLGYEVAWDRSGASLWVGWRDDDGDRVVRLWQSAPGMTWVAEAVREAVRRLDPRAVVADDGGPTRLVTSDLTSDEDDPVDVQPLRARDVSAATTGLLHALELGTFDHDGADTLTEQARGARLKSMGDLQVWDRRGSTGAIDAVIGLTVVLWGVDHGVDRSPAPAIHTWAGAAS